MVLHVWLVMTRQLDTDGGNGTVTVQGYGMFQTVDIIMVYSGGEVHACRLCPPRPNPYPIAAGSFLLPITCVVL